RARSVALERSTLRMRFSAYPLRCREILDRNERLSAPDLEAFWAELVQLSDYTDADDERPSLTTVADLVTGGVPLPPLGRPARGAPPGVVGRAPGAPRLV